MRLLCLNTCGGRHYDALMSFVTEQAKTLDILCFQEVFHTIGARTQAHNARANLFSELEAALPAFTGYFTSPEYGFDYQGKVDYPLWFGPATFVRRTHPVILQGDFMIHGERQARGEQHQNAPRNIQFVQVQHEETPYLIYNVHGLWTGNGKQDTRERLEQSHRILTCIRSHLGRKVLCGDFNLEPDTQSIQMLEVDMRNLITEQGIETTRSALYTKDCPWADYTFVSSDIQVKQFEALDVNISDHRPLLLEFE